MAQTEQLSNALRILDKNSPAEAAAELAACPGDASSARASTLHLLRAYALLLARDGDWIRQLELGWVRH